MTSRDQKQYPFNDVQARWFAPIVGFFDLESLIVPVEGYENKPKKKPERLKFTNHAAMHCYLLL